MTSVKPPDLGVDGASRVAPLIKNDKVHGSLYTRSGHLRRRTAENLVPHMGIRRPRKRSGAAR